MTKNKQRWRPISDKSVRHIWVCEICNQSVKIGPEFYVNHGNPICPTCDGDMLYRNTEILKNK